MARRMGVPDPRSASSGPEMAVPEWEQMEPDEELTCGSPDHQESGLGAWAPLCAGEKGGRRKLTHILALYLTTQVTR